MMCTIPLCQKRCFVSSHPNVHKIRGLRPEGQNVGWHQSGRLIFYETFSTGHGILEGITRQHAIIFTFPHRLRGREELLHDIFLESLPEEAE